MSFFALIDLINKGPSPPWKPGVITAAEFAEDVTRIQNEYRKLHQAYALRLSEDLCAHAQEWADTLIRSKELRHSNFRYKGTRISENISMKWSSDHRGYTRNVQIILNVTHCLKTELCRDEPEDVAPRAAQRRFGAT